MCSRVKEAVTRIFLEALSTCTHVKGNRDHASSTGYGLRQVKAFKGTRNTPPTPVIVTVGCYHSKLSLLPSCCQKIFIGMRQFVSEKIIDRKQV